MAAAAVALVHELAAACLVVLPNTGRTARFVSKYRPPCPCVLLTTDPAIARQSLLSRSVLPLVVDKQSPGVEDTQGCILLALHRLRAMQFVSPGQYVIVLHSELDVVPTLGLTGVASGSPTDLGPSKAAALERGSEGSVKGSKDQGQSQQLGSGSSKGLGLGGAIRTPEDLKKMGSLPNLLSTDRTLSKIDFPGPDQGLELDVESEGALSAATRGAGDSAPSPEMVTPRKADVPVVAMAAALSDPPSGPDPDMGSGRGSRGEEAAAAAARETASAAAAEGSRRSRLSQVLYSGLLDQGPDTRAGGAEAAAEEGIGMMTLASPLHPRSAALRVQAGKFKDLLSALPGTSMSAGPGPGPSVKSMQHVHDIGGEQKQVPEAGSGSTAETLESREPPCGGGEDASLALGKQRAHLQVVIRVVRALDLDE